MMCFFFPQIQLELICLASGSMLVDDDMTVGDEQMEMVLNKDLERQICDAIDPRFLLQLVCPIEFLLFSKARFLSFYTSKSLFTTVF